MANTILVPIVGSTGANPQQFTAQSPSFNRYFPIPNTPVKYFGDYAQPSGTVNPNGITPLGFLYVEVHENNQWKPVTYYTNLTGAQIATLFG